ncbi:PBSX family phage terminase large subunit [Clostridium estertheticum]|uniref:PBSX family phage terminase large subunit n=1 Tax=Clostridium estertheticum TaxID=238834 RepID=UPI001C7CD96D|nr:PBSX family phage terminase large subunit [Clostridium estertheticum]MBX4266555.1 PBSX family phage terminase large subunit [Clostridium estertheticum]WLC88105.1 PBSX family phage terminase large subunit [Clostridium estertheticum]
MIEYQPFGQKSLDFINNPIEKDARINILEGSVRSSKTVTMIPKWLDYIVNGPKGLLIMTGVSKDTIYDNVLNDLFDTVGVNNYTYNRQTGDLNIYGRKIKVVGAKDEGSEKYIRGKTLAGAYCDEVSLMPEKFFKQLLNRMSVKGAKLYATTNPDTPFHYLYTEYITDPKKLLSGMVKVLHFMLDDNPNLDDEYKEFIRGAYKGLWYDRMILGLWKIAEGAIYDMFTEANEYLDGDGPNYELAYRRYYCMDYGTINPCVFLEVIEQEHKYYIESEYYYNSKKEGIQKDDSEYADDLLKFIDGKRYTTIIIDPSAASFKIAARRKGIRLKDANNDVLDGIRLVASLLSLKLLKVNKNKCPNFVSERSAYIWDEKAAKIGEEKPIKAHDHAMDAIRYFCKTIIKVIRGVK